MLVLKLLKEFLYFVWWYKRQCFCTIRSQWQMVERENRGKDDGRKTSTRESSRDTKISAPESESSVIGAAITNFTTSSETCNRPNENSSSNVATANTIVTGIDDIINIFVKKNKEQGSQRKDVRTLRTSVIQSYRR